MTKITICGKDHDITYDGFGLVYIDGITVDQFLNRATPKEVAFLAKKGMSVAKNDPEHFADIVDRREITPLEPFVDPEFRG